MRLYKIRFAAAANPEPADRHNPKKLKVFWGDREVTQLTLQINENDKNHPGWKDDEFEVRARRSETQQNFKA